MASLHSLALLFALAAPASLGDGYLGVMLANAARPTVAEVLPNSPAEKAGIKPGDVFVSVDGVVTTDEVSFAESIRKRNAGERVKLAVLRGKEQITIEAVLGKFLEDEAQPKPAPKPQAKDSSTKPWLGLSVEEDNGVQVRSVLDDSPAARAGLKQGDVLRRIGSVEIRDLESLDKAMQKAQTGKQLEVEVVRAGKSLTIEVTVGSAPAAMPAVEPRRAEAPAEPKKDAPKAAEPKKETPKKDAPKPAEPRKDTPSEPEATAKGRVPAEAPEFRASVREALAAAKEKQRPVLLVFGASWSAACSAQRRSLGDPSLADSLARFERVWIDTDQNGKLADDHGVRELPCMVVLDASGKTVEKVDGYRPPDMLRPWLDKHAQKKGQPAETDANVSRRRGPAAGAPEPSDLAALREELARLRAEVKELKELVGTLRTGAKKDEKPLRKD